VQFLVIPSISEYFLYELFGKALQSQINQ